MDPHGVDLAAGLLHRNENRKWRLEVTMTGGAKFISYIFGCIFSPAFFFRRFRGLDKFAPAKHVHRLCYMLV